jgi:hypothetical protein
MMSAHLTVVPGGGKNLQPLFQTLLAPFTPPDDIYAAGEADVIYVPSGDRKTNGGIAKAAAGCFLAARRVRTSAESGKRGRVL